MRSTWGQLIEDIVGKFWIRWSGEDYALEAGVIWFKCMQLKGKGKGREEPRPRKLGKDCGLMFLP